MSSWPTPTVLELEKLQSAASSAPAVDYSPRPVYPLTNLQFILPM